MAVNNKPLVSAACVYNGRGADAFCFYAKQVRLVLPEGLELSKLFYFWLSATLDRYLGDGATPEESIIFRENVFGISLSATGLSEVSQDMDVTHASCSDFDGMTPWHQTVIRPFRLREWSAVNTEHPCVLSSSSFTLQLTDLMGILPSCNGPTPH